MPKPIDFFLAEVLSEHLLIDYFNQTISEQTFTERLQALVLMAKRPGDFCDCGDCRESDDGPCDLSCGECCGCRDQAEYMKDRDFDERRGLGLA